MVGSRHCARHRTPAQLRADKKPAFQEKGLIRGFLGFCPSGHCSWSPQEKKAIRRSKKRVGTIRDGGHQSVPDSPVSSPRFVATEIAQRFDRLAHILSAHVLERD